MSNSQMDTDRVDYFDAAHENDEYYAAWAEALALEDTSDRDDPWAEFEPVDFDFLPGGPDFDSEPPF